MRRTILILLLGLVSGNRLLANDVEPRLYSNVPVGVNFLTIGYASSQGEVTFDSSIPVEGAKGDIDAIVLSYSRGLSIAGRSALLTVALPYADFRLKGLLLGQPASGQRQGFGDPLVRLSVNFYGAPALKLSEYASYQQKTIVGGSISIGMPFGRYLEDKVINIGTNRWNLIGQIGISHRTGPWTVESAIGLSWYSDNEESFGDRRLEQDPIALARATVIYNFNRGIWVGAGVLYADGGQTTIDGFPRDDRQENWRTGAAMSIPLARRHRLLLKVTEGITARIGSDFRTFSASYTYTF